VRTSPTRGGKWAAEHGVWLGDMGSGNPAVGSRQQGAARLDALSVTLRNRRNRMESATFRKWLADQGCRFDTDQEKRGKGHENVTVHRERRKAEVPLSGPHQILDERIVRRACEELGLDWSGMPGPTSRV
jgi:hypothetical protein